MSARSHLPAAVGAILFVAGFFGAVVRFAAAADPALPSTVVFNRDIRPILSDKCYACHGPDEANRKTALRFDRSESALAPLPAGGRAIAPGDPKASAMVERITSNDPARRMPPAYLGHDALPDREIALIRRWIEQGAEWQKHWSFLAPEKAPLPQVLSPGRAIGPIDHFIVRRFGREGLTLSPEAARPTLIRRATLDLTGLPPTPAEVDAFLADRSADAYERVVDRLLASPRYGERMSYRWLDAARYADTHGYQNDRPRDMWRWRDWVIEAFNSNMRFDRFTIEQLAGDLLPDPTLDQLIATAFNRNHRGNGELGIVPEEYHVEYVVDRVETTSTVWMGLTMGCARCHDHKYDPVTQKEFYRFYAYFNNVPDRGRYFKYGNTPPVVAAPTCEQSKELALLDGRIETAREAFAALQAEIEPARREWEESITASGRVVSWAYERDLLYRFPMDDGVISPGKARFDGSGYVDLGDRANFSFYDEFSVAARIDPETPTGGIVTRLRAEASTRGGKGWGFYLEDGKLLVDMISSDIDDRVTVETREPIAPGPRHVVLTYDGSRLAAGVRLFVDGRQQASRTVKDHSNNDFQIDDEPLRIGHGPRLEDRFQGQIGDVRIYDRRLTGEEVLLIAAGESVTAIAGMSPQDRTEAQQAKIRRAFLSHYAPKKIRDAWRSWKELEDQRERLVDGFPTVMVMAEMDPPRRTRLLKRGAYDAPGESVTAAVPSLLPALPAGAPNNRLGLARWIVDRENPLTARVTVNRFWQMLFGTGLVASVENFGSQGEWPTHPELLDWLAVEFMESGWDVKSILKTIVMSATYRQSSKVTPELIGKDAENRLLARGPRLRLAGESIRDQALAISGLLTEQQGGPSVRPYQPPGLWKELSNWDAYEHDRGDKLYRRGLYTFWKRTIAPPAMLTFDASDRETCIVRETRTNTPLQALNLMNDVTYVEAARKFAERLMREGGPSPEQRLAYGFRLATARLPAAEERAVLLQSFRRYRDRFQTAPQDAVLYLGVGESQRDETIEPAELAAYAAVAGLILNLDETITKE